jgi:2,5-furandicarboxylate decarboxylase 1
MGKDLRSFLELVKQKIPEDFLQIEEEIGTQYETTAWVKSYEREGKHPIFFFPRVKGFNRPIVSNLFGSRKVMALALDTSPGELIKTFREKQKNLIPPQYMTSGPVRDLVFEEDAVDLSKLPITFHHEGDSAPYITGGILTVFDPETGKNNCSYHRLMVVGKNRLRTHIAPGRHLEYIFKRHEEKNSPLPCSIFIGHHPALGLGSVAMTPRGIDEVEVMGGMLGEAIDLLKGERVECIYPAHAEIVLEAEILPNIREEEGPFAEFTGYAAGLRKRQVILVKSLCMRKDAIYHDLIAGANEHLLLGSIAREAHFYELARSISPYIQSVSIPLSGAGRFHCYVSLDKQNEGQVNQIGMALLGADPMLKHIVIVDKDIDLFNEREVLWAVATRVQADRDIHIIPNCSGSDLDPSTQYPPGNEGKTAKMIVNATAKPSLNYEAYSRKNHIPKEVENKIKDKIFGDPSGRGYSI